MKKNKPLVLIFILLITSISYSQVGIGTLTPKSTLQIEGNPNSTTTPDGIQVPALSLALLDAKINAYGADQDGSLLYVNDVSTASTTSQTAGITATGFYYYQSASNKWIKVGENTTTTPTSYAVGDFAHGGVVFAVDATGQHGLVCAIEDQSAGIKWRGGTTNYTTMAQAESVYAGKMNTAIIIAVHAAKNDIDNHAALVCANYNGGGFSDWYLPSRFELQLMYFNRAIINTIAMENSGSSFANNVNDFYWSSTEIDSDNAWAISFEDTNQNTPFINFKIFPDRVRAIRAF